MTEHDTQFTTQTVPGKKKRKNKHKKKRHSTLTNATTEASNTEDQQDADVDAEAVIKPSTKRSVIDDDSDEEQTVKKKKKKKNKPPPSEPTGKKSAKSIRQSKREKHAQRLAEAESNAKCALKEQGLSYLSQWKHDRNNWKFMKAKQAWLYRNKFSPALIPDDLWPLYLEYFTSAHGNIKKMLLEDANKIITKMDDSSEKEQNVPNDDEEKNEKPSEETQLTEVSEKPDAASYKRARDIIQHLEE